MTLSNQYTRSACTCVSNCISWLIFTLAIVVGHRFMAEENRKHVLHGTSLPLIFGVGISSTTELWNIFSIKTYIKPSERSLIKNTVLESDLTSPMKKSRIFIGRKKLRFISIHLRVEELQNSDRSGGEEIFANK